MIEKVCIIGAGPSGLTAAKILKERAIPFDCFEMGSDIGGNWRYNNDNGRSAAYRSLHIDTSKERMAYSDFPMPNHYPDYLHHRQVLEYLENYAAHFGLWPAITFRTRVDRVAPAPDDGYDVNTTRMDTGTTRTQRYRAVLVCNGHHWNPKWPNFPGTFSGRQFHSRYYRTPDSLEGLNVLIVGIGNSGADIACEVSQVARQTFLSTRRSAHIVPRHVLGRPADRWVTPLSSRLPLRLQRLFYRILLRLARGDQENYGVPRPDHKLLSAHPTLSDNLLDLVAQSRIIMKPDVKELAGHRVRFADHSEEAVDVIIYATGYKISFPFLDPDFLVVEDNEIPLYRKVVHPDRPNLYFIGLIQPLGAIMPLAELQAKWAAGLLTGKFTLPDRMTMLKAIAKEQAELQKRYVKSTRHTIEVDYYPYMRLIQHEMKRGRRQAIHIDNKPKEAGLG